MPSPLKTGAWNSDPDIPEIFSYAKTIHLQNNLSNAELSVTICNSMGELVRTEKTSDASASFELDDAAAGIYFVHISSPNTTVEKEVLIQ